MLNANYVVGLIDGEGSFTVYVNDGKNSRERVRRTRIEPRFYIKLVEEDKDILGELKKYFKCGNVYFQKDKRPNHQNCFRYEVTKREDLNKIIIPFFKKNPVRLKTKARDFKIFCQIMAAINAYEHLSDAGLKRLFNLKQKMH
ncbi:MAG: LAGLIDADG family homing endonuclease [Patescibacteria group bacterium]|nr:LAGLIDADG family homing endonuclease [Patescibacteria group bacterium]